MTTKSNKRKTSYYVFTNNNGDSKIVGNIYLHKNGKSLDIKIGDNWYSAHPPKNDTSEVAAMTEEGA